MVDHTQRKLTVLLHADVVSSTSMVQLDESLAHERFKITFQRLSGIVQSVGGTTHELRGDALVAEFARASDAITAALSFQSENQAANAELNDDLRPQVRIGISLGEVVVADGTVTGAGVVLAQRVEQLADSNGVCITGAVHEAVPRHLPLEFTDLGRPEIKGFEEPVQVYRVSIRSGEKLVVSQVSASQKTRVKVSRSRLLTGTMILAIVLVGVLTLWQPWQTSEEVASPDRMAFPLPDKPSIAVLPFTNMSEDSNQEYFADGMTEDLITDLSKISGLFVIARNSSFSYKDRQVKVQHVAEDLGVRYVLEGSVRRAGDQVRINAQLIDAMTGGHLWAERYDGTLADIFSLQDQVTRKIISALSVALLPGEGDGAKSSGTSNIEAHDAYLQGQSFYLRNSPVDNARAEPYFQRAIELDPQFSRAYSSLANVYLKGAQKAFANKLGISPRKAAFFSYKILGENPVSYGGELHVILARASLYKHQLDNALREVDLALEYNANDIDALKIKAIALIFSGQQEVAKELVDRIIRLDPAALAEPMYISGLAKFASGAYDKAATFLERAIQNDSSNSTYHRLLAATYGLLGKEDEASKALGRYRKSRGGPFWIAAAVFEYPFEDDRVLQALAKGFEMAGLSERPPAKYMKLNSETRLISTEINALLTGHTIKGTHYWRGFSWTLHRSVDGTLKQDESGTFFYSYGWSGQRELEFDSRIEGDQLCHPGIGVNKEITICVTLYRDSVRGDGHYYMLTDTGPHPFTVAD